MRLVGLVAYCLFLVEERKQRKVLTVQEREKARSVVWGEDGRMWELGSIVSHLPKFQRCARYAFIGDDLPGCETREGASSEASMPATASSPEVSGISSL